MSGVALARPTLGPRLFGRVNWLGLWSACQRELTRALKWPLMTFGGPVLSAALYFTTFRLSLGDDAATPHGAQILTFMVPGMIAIFTLQVAAEPAFSIVFDKVQGCITDLVMAPLTAAELTASYLVSGAAPGVVTGLMLLAASAIVWPVPVQHPLLLLFFLLAASVSLAAWGILAGLWANKWDHLGAAMGFFLTPLTFLSGSFAPIAALPPIGQAAMRVNPIFYMVDGVRYACLGQSGADPALSAAVVLVTGALLCAAAYGLIRRGYSLKS